jgi:hypothetical protein
VQLATAVCFRKRIALPNEAWSDIDALLTRYCDDASIDEKRRTVRHLDGVDLGEILHEASRGAVAGLSPAGKLLPIRCPVSIVHAANDAVVSVEHAERIVAELNRRGQAIPTRFLVTPLMAHVTKVKTALPSVPPLMRILAPLVESDKAEPI